MTGSKMRRRISMAFLLAGILGVGVWTWSIVRGAIFQRSADRIFDDQTSIAPQRPASPSPPEPGALIGRLAIPRLHLHAIVLEGTDSRTLDVALGHVPGTALPGHFGNVAIAGHRDTLFRCLRNISKGDLIVLQATESSYTYSVENTAIVKPQDISVLAPASKLKITLVTCYPFNFIGRAPDRFIVQACLLPKQPAEPGPIARPLLTREEVNRPTP